ncbi:chitin synthase 2 [Ephemerocybe angulata]|uniref:Chitin synthase n=1 Tax=Ephemerocybe angulata TaxID=980116 RepID=A0A8H6M6U0_9AGAR|nr:chitin synthase 2 [Tulosesus angulatus]
MAYRPQPDQYNDDYNNYNTGNYNNYNTGATPGYPPSTGHGDWDAKSYQSSYAGSQAHLNPHEMSQVQAPPMPYHNPQMPQYPPAAPRPGMGGYRNDSGWSAAREKLMKRRSVRQVQLTQGNLVLDVPAPSGIMRYTAATCDPDDFMKSRYTLRTTELFIVMTMYNEDEVLFVKTMNSVIKNIQHLCSRSKSKMWGTEGWKKVVVCVVSDGRNKVNKRTLQVLSLMGCYQEGIAKDSVAGKDVTAHIFEYTTSVMVTETGEVAPSSCPIQVLFCLKEQNKKKLNSHRWFFNAFGPLLKPNVCILLDVGTKPTGTSIYELWKCFDKHSSVGGACGEICVDSGRGCGLLLTSPLAASQNFESVFGYISVLPGAFSAYRYKALLNGPDGKGPLASYFKGEAMHGAGSDAGLFERNMYLAEDRILCFEIVTKKKEGWTLKYVKSAKASTDVPTSVPEFISQRRRWLNGSLFASIHATVFFFRIWTSGQNFFRKIILQIEFIYNAINLLFTWTSLANFYLAFFFLVSSATAEGDDNAFNFLQRGAGKIVFDIFLNIYIGLLFVVLVCSLGNRPQGSKWTYSVAMVLFGLCNIVTMWCAGYTVYLAVPHTVADWKNFPELFRTNKTLQDITIAVLATYGMYFISSFMHFEPWHMFTSFIQYMFLLPSYVNILMMYAMCNLHDVTWGTKGDNGAAKDLGSAKKVKGDDGKEMMEVELPTAKEDVEQLWQASKASLRIKPVEEKEHRDAATKQTDHDRNSRTNVVLAWVGSNMVLILVFTSQAFNDWVAKRFATGGSSFNPYLTFLFYVFAGLSAVRFTGSFLYLIFRLVGL